MKNIIVIGSAGIVAVVFLLSVYFGTRTKLIVIQGVADATEVRISSRVPGRVDNIYVAEGDSVKTGELLITLDAPDLRAKVVQADGARMAAGAQLEKAKSGARKEEVTSVFNLWQKATVAERISKQTLSRIEQLYRDGVVSAQQRDEAQAKYDASRQDTMAAKAQYDMAQEGARAEDKLAANAVNMQASGALQEVESYLADTSLSAPINGEVSTVVLSKGELAASGFPLITITDLSDVYFNFNIREDLMPHFKMNGTFEVLIPAVDKKKHKVTITYIAPRGDFAVWSSTKTTGGFDLKTFLVRARPVEPIESLRPGMSAIYRLAD